MKSGSLKLLEPLRPVQTCNGIALPLLLCIDLYSICAQFTFWSRIPSY